MQRTSGVWKGVRSASESSLMLDSDWGMGESGSGLSKGLMESSDNWDLTGDLILSSGNASRMGESGSPLMTGDTWAISERLLGGAGECSLLGWGESVRSGLGLRRFRELYPRRLCFRGGTRRFGSIDSGELERRLRFLI